MLKLTFAGAAGEVTGSCHHLATPHGNLLIDCGFFQGRRLAEAKNHDPFPFNPAEVSAVLLTHAHLDHVGRLPKLVEEGFPGPIYATEATAELAKLVLLDTVGILAEHAEQDGTLPLYGRADVEATLKRFKAIQLDEPFSPLPAVRAAAREAGHILGSVFFELEADGKRLVFSGDLGNVPSPLLNPSTEPVQGHVVVIESTYGGKTHEAAESRLKTVHTALDQIIAKRGTLLIPAFAIERTQELLFFIDALARHREIRALPVFLDSPLAIEVTNIYKRFPGLFQPKIAEELKHGSDPFNFPFLKMTRSVQASRQINHIPGPKVVIAGAGMMEGGRIHHHLIRHLDEETTTLLIVGFQSPGTLGREIADGAKQVELEGQPVKVRAQVEQVQAFSAHADEPQLLHFLSALKAPPEHLFTVHGEPESSQALLLAIKKAHGWSGLAPKLGQTVSLD